MPPTSLATLSNVATTSASSRTATGVNTKSDQANDSSDDYLAVDYAFGKPGNAASGGSNDGNGGSEGDSAIDADYFARWAGENYGIGDSEARAILQHCIDETEKARAESGDTCKACADEVATPCDGHCDEMIVPELPDTLAPMPSPAGMTAEPASDTPSPWDIAGSHAFSTLIENAATRTWEKIGIASKAKDTPIDKVNCPLVNLIRIARTTENNAREKLYDRQRLNIHALPGTLTGPEPIAALRKSMLALATMSTEREETIPSKSLESNRAKAKSALGKASKEVNRLISRYFSDVADPLVKIKDDEIAFRDLPAQPYVAPVKVVPKKRIDPYARFYTSGLDQRAWSDEKYESMQVYEDAKDASRYEDYRELEKSQAAARAIVYPTFVPQIAKRTAATTVTSMASGSKSVPATKTPATTTIPSSPLVNPKHALNEIDKDLQEAWRVISDVAPAVEEALQPGPSDAETYEIARSYLPETQQAHAFNDRINATISGISEPHYPAVPDHDPDARHDRLERRRASLDGYKAGKRKEAAT